MAQLVAGREEDFEAVRETAAFKVDAIGEEMKMKMLEKISREYKKRNHKERERERELHRDEHEEKKTYQIH